MKRSQVRDAINTQKFFFRTNIDTTCDEGKSTSEPVVREMTLDQIMNGDGDNFKGLIPILTEYLRDNEVSNGFQISNVNERSSFGSLLAMPSKGLKEVRL